MPSIRRARLATFTLLSATLLGPAQAEDWPRFLGPTGDGKSTESIRTEWPAEGPPILWHREVGEGYSAPSIADGRLYVFDRVEDEARLAAWNPATGEDVWRVAYTTDYEDYYDYSGGPRTSPVIHDGRVFTFGVEGRLRAHAVADGAVLWDVDTAARYGVVQNFFGVGASPVVEGGLLIVMVGGSPQDSPSIHSGKVRGNGTGLVAFDLESGEERWRLSDELASYATPTLATVHGRRHGFAFTRGGLLGFDPSDGTERFFFPWRAKKLESVNAASPLVVDDTVLITESYGPGAVLLRLPDHRAASTEQAAAKDDASPAIVWQDARRGKSLESHWSTPIHHRGFVYASSGQSTGEAELRAIEHATGEVAWSEPGLGRSTLLYADDHLLVLTETGRLLLVAADPTAYRKVAEIDLGDRQATASNEEAKAEGQASADGPRLRFPVWNAPVLSNGRLFLRGRDQIVTLDVSPTAADANPDPASASASTEGQADGPSPL